MYVARTRSTSLNATPERLPMLRRALKSLSLYVCLLLAGIPAVACADAVPMQECCPSAPGAPCHSGGPDAPQGMLTALACCASGAQSSTANTAMVALPKMMRQAAPIDPPVAINADAFPAITRKRSHANVAIAFFSRSPSFSTLYLSTGRLRL